MLLEAWRDAESSALAGTVAGDRAQLTAVEGKFPRKIKMKRPVFAEDGVTELGTEEYFDYVFPDDEKKMGTLLLCVWFFLSFFFFIFLWESMLLLCISLSNIISQGCLFCYTDSMILHIGH